MNTREKLDYIQAEIKRLQEPVMSGSIESLRNLQRLYDIEELEEKLKDHIIKEN